jgi:hypothetical protein
MLLWRKGINWIWPGLPLLFRTRTVRLLCAVLIVCWVVLGAASIGLFYIPSAIVMAWSAMVKSE